MKCVNDLLECCSAESGSGNFYRLIITDDENIFNCRRGCNL